MREQNQERFWALTLVRNKSKKQNPLNVIDHNNNPHKHMNKKQIYKCEMLFIICMEILCQIIQNICIMKHDI